MVEILSVPGRAIDGLLHGSAIFRMGAFNNHINGDRGRLVISKDPKGFRRPGDLAGGDAPAETTGEAQSLRLGKMRFVWAQSFFGVLALGDVLARNKDDQLVVQPP